MSPSLLAGDGPPDLRSCERGKRPRAAGLLAPGGGGWGAVGGPVGATGIFTHGGCSKVIWSDSSLQVCWIMLGDLESLGGRSSSMVIIETVSDYLAEVRWDLHPWSVETPRVNHQRPHLGWCIGNHWGLFSGNPDWLHKEMYVRLLSGSWFISKKPSSQDLCRNCWVWYSHDHPGVGQIDW